MRIYLAAMGWEHTQWQGDFYPEDLPQDWRLSYYANEFQAVAVPAELWVDAPADRISGWLADTSPRFRFFLLLDENNLEQARTSLSGVVEQLGAQCGALVVFTTNPSRELLERLNDCRPEGLKIALVADREAGDVAAQSGISLNWTDEQNGAGSLGGAVCVLQVPPTEEPKQLRALAEKAGNWDCQELLMLFDGIAPKLGGMRAMGVIVDLLG